MEMQELVDELSTSPRYSHAVFGRFDVPGHYVQETRGNFPNLGGYRGYANNEKEYTELFDRQEGGPEFIARIHGANIPNGFKLKLMYNDRQGDSRPASHTDYMLIVPSNEIERIVPQIAEVPESLIHTFRNVFPGYDRSGGNLQIDPSWKPNF